MKSGCPWSCRQRVGFGPGVIFEERLPLELQASLQKHGGACGRRRARSNSVSWALGGAGGRRGLDFGPGEPLK